ncbi:hypothetical protein [Tahibacter amnicola]|uniref:Uncharacterized protein n=1 Tax=Tahibacter amnicola TaxID=2976241 RepID=A0ABY6B7T3_9GAMM|nr:hypothetical protein [Tahibacter amnicola]UXI66153.1 hypothetical protein N4264_15500 [Tahibacter amnicola]
MSSWEWRVMTRDDVLAIYEVYYDESGRIVSTSADPTFPSGLTIEELRENLQLYAEALTKPVLSYEE